MLNHPLLTPQMFGSYIKCIYFHWHAKNFLENLLVRKDKMLHSTTQYGNFNWHCNRQKVHPLNRLTKLKLFRSDTLGDVPWSTIQIFSMVSGKSHFIRYYTTSLW